MVATMQIVFTVFATFVGMTAALKCYICSGNKDSDCSAPTKKGLEPVDCGIALAECFYTYTKTTIGTTVETFQRGCTTFTCDEKDDITLFSETKTECCLEEGCNGAVPTSGPTVLILALAATITAQFV